MTVPRRLALPCLVLILVALGPIVPACATFGVPTACLEVCDGARDAQPCQQCLQAEAKKREEARQKRAEERRQAPPPPSGGGGSAPGGY
jgi:hypothetical protein